MAHPNLPRSFPIENFPVASDDLDTRQESASIGAVMGAMGEQYWQEIGRRTRRGLEGRARAQKPTGGKAYGYRAIEGGKQIDLEQAAIVRAASCVAASAAAPT